MNLHQLRFVREAVRQNYNLTEAAKALYTSQPGVSKAMIDTHETAAFEALWLMELTGALSWLGLWQFRRLSRVPQGTLAAVGLASRDQRRAVDGVAAEHGALSGGQQIDLGDIATRFENLNAWIA